jgi:hypothetical protein
MHVQRGLAYIQMQSGDPRENADLAIIELRLALELSPGVEERARRLMHLGLAFGQRVRGDRAENVESSVSALSDSMDLLDESADPSLRAIVSTNLANALLHREKGEPRENRALAADLCRQALGYRNPERDAVDWAHTQITLAAALDGMAQLDLASFDEATDAYGAVLREEGRLGDAQWLLAVAHHGLGSLWRSQADIPLEQMLEADEVPSPSARRQRPKRSRRRACSWRRR